MDYTEKVKLILRIVKIVSKIKPIRQFLNKTHFISIESRFNLGILNLDYTYAYLVLEAARAAKSLGIKKISIIEFGVAGGNGLIALEKISSQVESQMGISIDIYGFDTGTGLPSISDFRDLPYVWQEGHFPMDVDLLKSRLTKAQLILGNISETIPSFISEYNPAPIAAISFDLDLYTSTRDSFKLLESHEKYFLPRVLCYFDDILGGPLELYNEFTGERLAINEFNLNSSERKICPVTYLEKLNRELNNRNVLLHSLYSFHIFSHSMYNKHLSLELGDGLYLR